MINALLKDLDKLKNPKKAELLARFFKTGKGEYGQGDKFLGIMVPQQRKIVGKYKNLSLTEVQQLLNAKIHEYRLIGLLILVEQYKKASPENKKEIFDFYLKNTKNINNWDLVDLSAPNIVGDYLFTQCHTEPFGLAQGKPGEGAILYKLAKSKSLWEKRISIISTAAFIRKNMFKDALRISEILLNDKHDLIHKAVGWMLREVGKRSLNTELEFLDKYYKTMPRTMLRYAIEKLDSRKKNFYMVK